MSELYYTYTNKLKIPHATYIIALTVYYVYTD